MRRCTKGRGRKGRKKGEEERGKRRGKGGEWEGRRKKKKERRNRRKVKKEEDRDVQFVEQMTMPSFNPRLSHDLIVSQLQ